MWPLRQLALFSFLLGLIVGNLPNSWHLDAAEKFMGVASCSSSGCHGGVVGKNVTPVLQNEYHTWLKYDRHSKAYETLFSQHSAAIAKNLGIDKAHDAPECLNCHSTYVSNKSLQGRYYSVEEGVSCESCHGAAERYLSPHSRKGASHSKNLTLGLIDLSDYHTRAQVCLNCHYGNEQTPVTHRLYGAGHPRLSFELDSYTAVQPPHWNVDQDYVQRKGGYSASQAWLAGQVERASRLLTHISNPELNSSGKGLLRGPDFSITYCYSCHHQLEDGRWKHHQMLSRQGNLTLNLSSLYMVTASIKALNPELGVSLLAAIRLLQSNPGSEQLIMVVDLFRQAESMLKGHRLNKKQKEVILSELALMTSQQTDLFYEDAEQVAMAITALAIDTNQIKKFQAEIDRLYDTLIEPSRFQPEIFKKSVGVFDLQKSLKLSDSSSE